MTKHSGNRDSNEVAETLSAYWDRLVGGDAADAAGAPEGLVDMVDRLHASDSTPALLPRQRKAIWQEIMATHLMDTGPQKRAASRPLGVNGREPGLALPQPTRMPRWSQLHSRPGWVFAQLATAALLLLTLVGSFFAFGPGGLGRQQQAPAPIPAISGTPATPETVTTETLLDTTIATLPVGRAQVEVDFWRLRPDPEPLSLPALGGTMILLVDSGQITASVAGVEQHLAAGEHVILTGNQAGAFAVAGDAETSAFTVHLASGSLEPAKESALGPDGYTFDYLIYTSTDGLSGGSGGLVLERLTLPPGSALPPEEVQPWVWTEVGSGVLGLTLEGERLPFRWKSGAERTFRFAQRLPNLQPGTRMTLRNAGDESLILYRLTLTADMVAGAGRTPSTGTPVS